MSTLAKVVWFVALVCAAIITVAVLWSVTLGWVPTVGIGS